MCQEGDDGDNNDNSALQRARTTLARRNDEEPGELSEAQQAMLTRYVAAFEQYDVDGLTALMRDDVTFCMPPTRFGCKAPQKFEFGCWVWEADAGAPVWFPRRPAVGRPSHNIARILTADTRLGL